MAEKRKLLAEMDKCFKKIDEGVEIFEETMKKMHEANSDNQREKFQDDLKKEIKKLQRLRDQIKGWQNSSDIKDKEKLSQYRKLIEQRMETFKDIERENKTKPHSKQGLSAEDKLDPKEKEKADAIEWFNHQIRKIQDEIDRMESKIEAAAPADGGRKRGKGKDDPKKADKEKIEEYKKRLERVKFHMTNLEVCMRLITNEKLDIKTALDLLKEPIETYVDALDPENDVDPEELDPDDIYEELDLSSYIPAMAGVGLGAGDDDKNPDGSLKSPSGSPPPAGKEHEDKENVQKQRHQSGSDFKLALPKAVPAPPLKLSSQVSGDSSSLSSPPPATPPPPPGIPYNSVAAGKHHAALRLSTAQATAAAAATATQNGPSASSTPVKTSTPATAGSSSSTTPYPYPPVPAPVETPPVTLVTQKEEESPKPAPPTPVQQPVTPVTPAPPIESISPVQAPPAPAPTVSAEPTTPTPNNHAPPSPAPVEVPAVPVEVPAAREAAPAVSESVTQNSTSSSSTLVATAPASYNNIDDLNRSALQHLLMPQNTERSTQPQTATIPPWLGASPLGMVPIQGELEQQLSMIESSLPKLPMQMDSEKPRSYLPKMPCRTAAYYPQAPMANADSLEYYLRLAPETLFFTFYYMEGSRAQLLAAKALKKLSWRFHTKYLMWFQRHEEPKQITDDFEQGTYVYFDFEKWAQRKKEQFTFEYRYLEDG